jgi:hypothetical protein
MVVSVTGILIVIARAIYSSYEHYLRQLPENLSTGVKRVRPRRLKSLIWLTLVLFPAFDIFIGIANHCSPLRHDPAFVPAAGTRAVHERQPDRATATITASGSAER